MIPAPLALPVDVRPRPTPPPGRSLRRGAVVALAVAVFGAVVWAAGYSPIGYQRFDVFESTREMTFRRAGDYVVYEEFDGAGEVRLPTPIEVLVRDEDGLAVPVERAQEPGERAAPAAYDTRWHEGRALARFTVEEPGTYVVEVAFLPGEAGRYRPFEQVTLAVGREPRLAWMSGPGGLAVLAGIPLAVAVGLAVAGALAARRAPNPGRGPVDGR